MRLMSRDIQAFPLKRAAAVQSVRAGTKSIYEPVGHVSGQLFPVSDRYSVELYGDKAAGMYSLNVPPDTDIRKSDRVTLPDGDYSVISVKSYSTHKTASLEREGVL